MGLFGLLKSIVDLLYEVMTWLVFYPRTLLKVLRHPVQMMNYSDIEQSDADEEQYTDTLIPPLFLMISILIAHGIEIALHTNVETPKGGFIGTLLKSEENLLILRCILFSIYPLTFATALVNRSERPLDRNTLRGPFFSQCYLGGVFALLITLTTIMGKSDSQQVDIAAIGLGVLTIVWFIAVQSAWLREHLTLTRARSIPIAIWTFIKASFLNACVSAIFFV